MIPINNSDLAWLVVSDYNQENEIFGVDELREDVYNPEISKWYFEYFIFQSPGDNNLVVGGSVGGRPGDFCQKVGAGSLGLYQEFNATLVGGSM